MSLQAADRATRAPRRGESGASRQGAVYRRGRPTLQRVMRVCTPLVAGVVLTALTVSLGNWQMRRAQEKADMQQRFNQFARSGPTSVRAGDQPIDGQLLRLEGHWLSQHTILLDNRTQGGRAGYHVLTPLRLADGSGAVVVNRGWLMADADRSRLPKVTTPTGLQIVEGRMRPVEARPFSLGDNLAEDRRWQHLDVDRYRAIIGSAAGPQLADWTVQQTSAAVDGLSRDWPQPAMGADRHRGYALQWYALAGLFAALTAWHAGRLFTRKVSDER